MFISNEVKEDILKRLKKLERKIDELILETEFLKNDNTTLRRQLSDLKKPYKPQQTTPVYPSVDVPKTTQPKVAPTAANKKSFDSNSNNSSTVDQVIYSTPTPSYDYSSGCNSSYDSSISYSCDSSSSSCCD